jgi:hypothetical protein
MTKVKVLAVTALAAAAVAVGGLAAPPSASAMTWECEQAFWTASEFIIDGNDALAAGNYDRARHLFWKASTILSDYC